MAQILRAPLTVETYGIKEQHAWQLFYRIFREEHYPVTFRTKAQYLQSILNSTRKEPSSIWTMTSPSTFEELVFLRGISPLNTSIITKQSGCVCTCVTGMLIRYTVQKIAQTWISPAHATGIRMFSKIILSYLMKRFGNLFEVFSRKGDGYAAITQASVLAKPTGTVNKKANVAAEL